MKYLFLVFFLFLGGCIEGMCPQSQTNIGNIQLMGGFGLNISFMRQNDCCYVIKFVKNGNFNQPIDTLRMYNTITSNGSLITNNRNYTLDYDYLVRTNVGDYKITDFQFETQSCRTIWFRKKNDYSQVKSYKVNGILQNTSYDAYPSGSQISIMINR